jgi:hypothetical protein
MKTPEQMVAYAQNIADTEEDSVILVVVEDLSAYSHLYTELYSRRYKSKGTLLFVKNFSNIDECFQDVGGLQLSHCFVTSHAPLEVKEYLRGRIRSMKKFKEPCGMYYQWGVERWEDY